MGLNGVGWDFAANSRLGPGQTLVAVRFDPVTDSTAIANFEMAYQLDIATSLASFVGPYTGALDDGGERLMLFRAEEPPKGSSTTLWMIEDRVDYNDTPPWPTAPDGGGDSLHRIRSDGWAGDPSSWETGLPSPGIYGPIASYALPVMEEFIGEVGQLTNVTDVPQVVSLGQTYIAPVVFAQPASISGTDPVTVRVTEVQPSQFLLSVAEPSNLNGIHGAAETVSYVVFESGSHLLADGTQLEIGRRDTGATAGKRVTTPQWEPVLFSSVFSDSPVVMSQVQTQDLVQGQAYLSTRQQAISATGFKVALEQEEALTGQHVSETVGYLAIDRSSGFWNGLEYEAESTGANFTGDFSTLTYGSPFVTAPNFIASLASYLGADNAHLRFQNSGGIGVDLKVEEDTTYDTEIVHLEESVNYLAIAGQGSLSALSTQLVDGGTRVFAIDVSETGRISDLNVLLRMIHPRTSDLDVVLEAPDGTIVELFTAVGGDSDNFNNTVLDDEASDLIHSASGPFGGLFQPQGRLADLDGKEITGIWSLHVTDRVANSDRGILADWSLLVDLWPPMNGNANHDSSLDAEDIDLLYANLGSHDVTYDLDADGDIDQADVEHLVLNLLGTHFGDVELDFDVDIPDFNVVAMHYDPLGQSRLDGWVHGNFDDDDDVDIRDALQLMVNYALFLT